VFGKSCSLKHYSALWNLNGGGVVGILIAEQARRFAECAERIFLDLLGALRVLSGEMWAITRVRAFPFSTAMSHRPVSCHCEEGTDEAISTSHVAEIASLRSQ